MYFNSIISKFCSTNTIHLNSISVCSHLTLKKQPK